MRRPLIRLYALLRKPGYALFVFASATHLRAYRRLLDSLVQEVNNTYGGEIVRPHVVLDKGTPEAVEAEAPVLIDFKGQFRKKLGAGHGSVLLVRPDGYIAFHYAGHNLRALFAALEPWAGHGSPVRDRERPAAGGG